jgi:hypothetical protein
LANGRRTVPYKKASEPVIVPAPRRRDEKPVQPVASLIEPAPLTLLCMRCRTPRCATESGIVLWHSDAVSPAHECAGAGAPGLNMEET